MVKPAKDGVLFLLFIYLLNFARLGFGGGVNVMRAGGGPGRVGGRIANEVLQP